MRGQVDDISILLSHNMLEKTFYLEKASLSAFVSWINADPSRLSLIPYPWKIIVFKQQLASYGNYRARRRNLSDLGVEISNLDVKAADSLFIDEVERTYFSNSGVSHRQLAEFYLLVRRSEDTGWVNIISQDRSFDRIPMVNTFFFGTEARTGNLDLPAQFDFFRDFNIHPSLVRSVGQRLDDPSKGDVVREGLNTLQNHVRTQSGLTSDGCSLMNDAFNPENSNNHSFRNPVIRLNPLTDQHPLHSQVNEQRGFYQIYNGVITGLRNPIAHNMANSIYSNSRFPDKISLLKYLSLISILCERADGPLP
jgi:uncharacterized protein (TIGR02391 family)